MNEQEKKDVADIEKMAKNDQLVYLTFGVPIDRIEDFVEKLNSLGMNIYIKLPNEKKQKEAEMLFMDKNKVTVQ